MREFLATAYRWKKGYLITWLQGCLFTGIGFVDRDEYSWKSRSQLWVPLGRLRQQGVNGRRRRDGELDPVLTYSIF
jgi:hypothetical protein